MPQGRFYVGTKSRLRNTRKRRDRFILLSLLVLTASFIYLSRQSSASAASLQSPAMTTTSTLPVFSLLVTAQFSSIEYKKQFLLDIDPVAKYVRSSEPDTLAYEVLLSDKDSLQVLVLERYKDKENAYLKVHKTSAPFLQFRSKLQAMIDKGQVKISGHSYLDSTIGFGDRTLV
mmetsp:Transcript_4006/g.10478  ORF Transcript_4006/g.10478 Transcript_4006/m.10478 type:complete len:174 (-) Transcript_4006:67-588(-)